MMSSTNKEKPLFGKGFLRMGLRDSNPRPIGYEPTALTN